jgi:hypothetical protein
MEFYLHYPIPLHIYLFIYSLFNDALSVSQTNNVDVGGKPAASAQFLLTRLLEPEPSSSEAGETWAAQFCLQSIFFVFVRFFYMP